MGLTANTSYLVAFTSLVDSTAAVEGLLPFAHRYFDTFNSCRASETVDMGYLKELMLVMEEHHFHSKPELPRAIG